MNGYDLLELYDNWVAIEAAEDIERAVKTKGMFRGGSVGAIGARGVIYGTCPRIALARYWGWNDSMPSARKLMTDGGKGSEVLWDARFLKVLRKDKFLPEGAVKVSWQTVNGTEVSGTPDGTVLNADGTKTGIEHKRISSAWTARKVSVKRKPKKTHFIQACHYMVAGGYANYLLVYTQDVDFPCPGIGGMDSRALWPETQTIVEYQNGFPFRVQPHLSVYDISADTAGVFWFKHHAETQWTVTNITVDGIKSYYELASQQEAKGVLMGKPSSTSPFGDTGDSSTACSMCTLHETCKNKALRLSEFKSEIERRMK